MTLCFARCKKNTKKTFVPGIVGSLIMVSVIYAWSYMALGFSPFLRLAFSIIFGLVVYIGCGEEIRSCTRKKTSSINKFTQLFADISQKDSPL